MAQPVEQRALKYIGKYKGKPDTFLDSAKLQLSKKIEALKKQQDTVQKGAQWNTIQDQIDAINDEMVALRMANESKFPLLLSRVDFLNESFQNSKLENLDYIQQVLVALNLTSKIELKQFNLELSLPGNLGTEWNKFVSLEEYFEETIGKDKFNDLLQYIKNHKSIIKSFMERVGYFKLKEFLSSVKPWFFGWINESTMQIHALKKFKNSWKDFNIILSNTNEAFKKLLKSEYEIISENNFLGITKLFNDYNDLEETVFWFKKLNVDENEYNAYGFSCMNFSDDIEDRVLDPKIYWWFGVINNNVLELYDQYEYIEFK